MSNYYVVRQGDENSLKEAVKMMPVAVGIGISTREGFSHLHFYDKGVFKHYDCPKTPSHAGMVTIKFQSESPTFNV